MQNAASYLGLRRERGRRGLPLERVYRQLFTPELSLLAHGKLYRTARALTPGPPPETVDGMSLAKSDALIEAVRWERYRWTPVRRLYLEKNRAKKKRPRGVPSWSDNRLQEGI